MSFAAYAITGSEREAAWAVGSSTPRCTVPLPIYARVMTELCVRLWLELERLAIQCDAEEISHEPASLWLNAEILRLELLVLSDACDSAPWRSRLDVAQRGNLRSMSSEVLAAISFAPNALKRQAIERAQDRLFDEVLAQHTAVLS